MVNDEKKKQKRSTKAIRSFAAKEDFRWMRYDLPFGFNEKLPITLGIARIKAGAAFPANSLNSKTESE